MADGKRETNDVSEVKRRVLSELIWAIPRTYFRLTVLGDCLFGEYGLTAGKRAILRDISISGPQSISQMARSRPVARQYIQRLVAELAVAGLVKLGPNPKDGRSKLVSLSASGESLLARIAVGEAAFVDRLASDLDPRALQAARDVVICLRDRLASDELLTSARDQRGKLSNP